MAVAGYSRGQISLHWVVVVLVALQFLFSGGIKAAFKRGMDGAEFAAEDDREAAAEDTEPRRQAGQLTLTGPAIGHMAGGGLILMLSVLRLSLRRSRSAPPPPEADPAWQRAAARAAHWGLYGLLFAVPLAGVAAWAGASETAAEVHQTLTKVLLAVVAAHVLGALYGQFVQRTGVLGRMLAPRD